MQLWKGTSEQFVRKMGWIKKKGWRIDTWLLSDTDHFDNIYFEDLSDYVQKAEYWEHPTHSENVYEDVDYLIECEYEEYFDDQDNLWDEPVQEVEVKPNYSHD
jgi:hypothetical protein